MVRRCCVSYITGASNWYWLTVGQGLLSLWWVRVEGECFYFFCFFTFIPVPLSSLSLSFISSTLSSISFLPFSGRRHKMTLKGWRVIKPQHNQSLTSEHKIESLRLTVEKLQALQAKGLIFLIIFGLFVENHLLGNTKSFYDLQFESYNLCSQQALFFSLFSDSLLKITC